MMDMRLLSSLGAMLLLALPAFARAKPPSAKSKPPAEKAHQHDPDFSTEEMRAQALAAQVGTACGNIRFPVKTMTDAAASKVTLTPKTSTVSQLAALHAPVFTDNGPRVAAEMKTYTVTAMLIGYMQEGDQVFQLRRGQVAELTGVAGTHWRIQVT